MSDKTFYVTTPIYYVNARPHIGHAYTTIVADVLARRHRFLGEDTFFLTGTDEHGQKIERSAAAAGIPPQQFADQVSKSFEDLWHRMGITNNDYIRTTSDKHKRGVQKLFAELYARGFIYLASYTGSYCVSDEAFVDAPVGTPCPDCGRLLEEVTEENFFFKLSEFQQPIIDLIESGQLSITPDSRKNEVLSFVRGGLAEVNKISVAIGDSLPNVPGESTTQFLARVQDAANSHPDMIRLEKEGKIARSRLGERYVPGALKDLSISRSSFTWGIPVPEPAASTAAQKHVIYVWLDALANYMTALGYGSDDVTLFDKFWPADLHLVGKEIIRFHCVYWPAFLLALNPKLQHKSDEKPPVLSPDEQKAWAEEWLPKAITAHGWLLFEDSKMSKSKGNIVRTETILDAFGTLCPPPPSSEDTNRRGTAGSPMLQLGVSVPESTSTEDGASAPEVRLATKHERDLFASDVLRYFLLREIPFGQDGSFSFDALITRYNADLANGYGNLVSRTLAMVAKYFDSAIPDCHESESGTFYLAQRKETFLHREQEETLGATEGQILGWSLIRLGEKVDAFIASNSFDQALATIASGVSHVDQFLTTRKPWAATETEISQQGRRSTLYTAAESIRIITALLYPILPYATAKVWKQLGFEKSIEQAAADGELKNLEWGGLKPGTKLGPLGPIFPRADKGLAQIMTDMENPTPVDTSSIDPAAAPRTTSLPPATILPVGGSTALSAGPDPTKPAPEPSTAPTPAPSNLESPSLASPQITIDDFAKIELRVAQILVAERIPKADKLLRLEVDLGPFGKRQILSGIAEWYSPEDLIGRRIVVITNLAPRKMRGLESHGMLLAASHGENGKPVLATFGEDIALGSRLK
jgi:methionyl-tRNA synthetase